MSNRLNYLRDSTVLSRNVLAPTDPRVRGDEYHFDNGLKVNWKRAFTTDNFMTFDQFTIDSTGAFLIGELERLDQQLHDPLASVTWGRDVDLREDVTIADEVSSFTTSSFASAGGIIPAGKSWISNEANAISGVGLDIGITKHSLYPWGMTVAYTLLELASAQKLGRPVDVQKYSGMKLKWNMDVDEMVYIGDSLYSVNGLVNNTPAVSATNVATVSSKTTWADKIALGADTGANAILADVNTLLTNCWTNSGFAVMPSELRVPPVQFGVLVANKVSSAGNVSILEFLRNNSLCNAANGRPLNIQPLKWLTGRGATSTDRITTYTRDRDRIRFPLVPMQRTPIEYRGLHQMVHYYGRLGVMEFVYPETVAYMDGV